MKEDDTANQENLIIYLEKLKYLSVLLPNYIPEKIQSFEKKCQFFHFTYEKIIFFFFLLVFTSKNFFYFFANYHSVNLAINKTPLIFTGCSSIQFFNSPPSPEATRIPRSGKYPKDVSLHTNLTYFYPNGITWQALFMCQGLLQSIISIFPWF